MPLEDAPAAPSSPWRMASKVVMGMVGTAVRSFMYGPNSVEVRGLEGFLKLLDEREDVQSRKRGLITGERNPLLRKREPNVFKVSNHLSVYVSKTSNSLFLLKTATHLFFMIALMIR